MKVWIDLSNSPHPLLFDPIARAFKELGHEVVVTARDNAQTVELAREIWPHVSVIGGASPPGRASKGLSILDRVRQLSTWARARRPDVALSHNSYAQLLAARATRVRTVTAMDYEHQPVNHLAFRLANRVLMPAPLQGTRVRRMGASPSKTVFYPGLKEEIYLGDFDPNPGALREAGVDRSDGTVLVVARTPPSGALYHQADNPLFVEILRSVTSHPQVRCVTLTRRSDQREALAELGLPRLLLPSRALDARSLLHQADLVIGAGGTMTRESALLGVPTVSLFSGRPPAVDDWLIGEGRLRRISDVSELPTPTPRTREPVSLASLRARAAGLIEHFLRATLEPDWKAERHLDPGEAVGA